MTHTRPLSIFDNHRYFPPFGDLPSDNKRCFALSSSQPFVATYSHTWCFLGEIVNDDTAQIACFLQNGVWVKDRNGRDNVFVAFYPEKGSFNFTALKKGHTLCVLFAMEHIFHDKKVGLRIEDLDEVKVIPCGLDDVFDLGSKYFENKDSCWGCGYNPTLPSSAKASDEPIQDGHPTPTVSC